MSADRRGVAAIDAMPLIEGCAPGEPLQDEDIDPERLATFWKACAEKFAQRRDYFRTHYHEASWTPDTPPEPSTSNL